MVDSQLIAFALAAAALTIAPGPDTMLVIRNVLRGGRRDGVITTFGICSGLFVHATLSALGVSIILTRSAAAFSVVKLAGACYLGWLGWQSLRSAAPNVLNPKTAVFYLAFLPQFIGPTEPVLTKSLMLASIHYVEGLLWLSTLSMTLDHTRRFILKSAVRRWLDGLCGAVLMGFGVRLALARR